MTNVTKTLFLGDQEFKIPHSGKIIKFTIIGHVDLKNSFCFLRKTSVKNVSFKEPKSDQLKID